MNLSQALNTLSMNFELCSLGLRKAISIRLKKYMGLLNMNVSAWIIIEYQDWYKRDGSNMPRKNVTLIQLGVI